MRKCMRNVKHSPTSTKLKEDTGQCVDFSNGWDYQISISVLMCI